MNLKVIIPTKSRESVNKNLLSYLEDAGAKVYLMENKKSIFEAFSTISYENNEIIIFCHDDIEIISNKFQLKEQLLSNLSQPRVGFVGVAGAVKIPKSGVWWEDLKQPKHISENSLAGSVLHKGESLSFFGPYKDVEVLDGLFLAATGSTLNKINLKKPDYFPALWDFYDIYYTYQATKKKLINKVIPIFVNHDSLGYPREGWENNKNAFVKEFLTPKR